MKSIEIEQLIKLVNPIACTGDMNLQIKGLCYDSRQVKEGDLFVAIKGFITDGHLFLKEARKKGASAFVIEDKTIWDDLFGGQWMDKRLTLCLVSDSRLALALMANEFYGNPSQYLRLLGITGTNGKTTTCALISRILEVAGEKVGWINTLNYRIDNDIFPSQRTTPESLDLYRSLHEMVMAGCHWAVIEISSHSLILHRVAGCSFDAAILTNITQDHLDFHKTQVEYCRAKARLFDLLDNSSMVSPMDKLAVFNMDDPASREILKSRNLKTKNKSLTITYGIDHDADVTAMDIDDQDHGTTFNVRTPWGTHLISSSLIGRPNIYNILAVICVGFGFGIRIEDVKEGIKTMKGVPGRFEKINLGQNFDVIIDYAHTEDALLKLLSMVRHYTRGKVICVFGCGGDRDKTKRPLMGKAAATGSDWSILTSDNPRGEDPEKIIREIEEGFLQGKSKAKYEICIDRRHAIYRAIDMASQGDMVVITGKGHETTQIIGSEILPFDDREVVKQAIHDLVKNNNRI